MGYIYKYIYRVCEHHVDCDWVKPETDDENSNAAYLEHCFGDILKVIK